MEQKKLIEDLDSKISRADRAVKITEKKINHDYEAPSLEQENSLVQTSNKLGISNQHLGHSVLIIGWKKEIDPLD